MDYYDEINEYLKINGEWVDRPGFGSWFPLTTFKVSNSTYMKLFAKVLGIQVINIIIVNVIILSSGIIREKEAASVIIGICHFITNYICFRVVYNGLSYTLYRAKMRDWEFIMPTTAFNLLISIWLQVWITDIRIRDDGGFIILEDLIMMVGVLSMPLAVKALKNAEADKQIRDIIIVYRSRKYLFDMRPIKDIHQGEEVLR